MNVGWSLALLLQSWDRVQALYYHFACHVSNIGDSANLIEKHPEGAMTPYTMCGWERQMFMSDNNLVELLTASLSNSSCMSWSHLDTEIPKDHLHVSAFAGSRASACQTQALCNLSLSSTHSILTAVSSRTSERPRKRFWHLRYHLRIDEKYVYSMTSSIHNP